MSTVQVYCKPIMSDKVNSSTNLVLKFLKLISVIIFLKHTWHIMMVVVTSIQYSGVLAGNNVKSDSQQLSLCQRFTGTSC